MKISENVNLKAYNTFGVDCCSRYFTEVHTLDEVVELVRWLKQHDVPYLVVGGGSNLLFRSDYPGLVVHVGLEGKESLFKDDEASYIRVGAGENWHEFVRWTIDQGYAGLENLSLIPGTVGAAPVQNIGAYGVELVDRLHTVDAVDLITGELKNFDVEACRFGYRDSFFKSVEPGRYLITSVIFRLPHEPEWKISYAGVSEKLNGNLPSARLISDIIIDIRQSKLPDPEVISNAGSFFKNPVLPESTWNALKRNYPDMPGYAQGNQRVKTSAAWLIDKCGWKGYRSGDAGIYDKHALVLVNHGKASGSDLWDVAEKVIASVAERFSITLEPEPKIL